MAVGDSGLEAPTLATLVANELNDLSSAVTWANIPDANVPASAVTQHEAALTILESQISDLSHATVPATISQAEAEAGTSTTDRIFTAERVKQAIDALGSVSDPLLLGLGTVGVPTYSFAGDTNTGVFSIGADNVSLAAGGVEIFRATEGGIAEQCIVTPGLFQDVSTLPALAIDESNKGFYSPGAGILRVATPGGGGVFEWDGIAYQGVADSSAALRSTAATATVPSVHPNKGDLDTGLGSNTADQLSLIAGAIEGIRITEAGAAITDIKFYGPLLVDGSGGGPAGLYAFIDDDDTGMFLSSVGTLGWEVGGTVRMKLTAGGLAMALSGSSGLLNEVASATNPTINPNLNGDLDTGIGWAAADQLSLIAGGLELIRCTEAAVDQVIIGPAGLIGTVALPSLAWGDGDTGFVETSDDVLVAVTAGLARFEFNGDVFQSENITGPAIRDVAASAVTPVFIPNQADLDTGLGTAGTDAVALVSGGVEAVRYTEGSGVRILQSNQADVNLTADVGSAQGNGLVGSTYNHFSTVANAGDAATLPSSHPIGTRVWIRNQGANSMDVFPSAGDTIEPNAINVAEAVAAGTTAMFMTIFVNDTWTRMV